MSSETFNRTYKDYQPSMARSTGPTTKRICKPVQCNNKKDTPSS